MRADNLNGGTVKALLILILLAANIALTVFSPSRAAREGNNPRPRHRAKVMWRDAKFAVRTLVKTPAFSIIAILAIALGIGISTTMFSSVNALLVRPMPFIKHQDRLVYVSHFFTKQPEHDGMAFPDYLEYRKAKTFDGLGAYQELTVIVSDGEKPVRYFGAQISADAFSSLGVQPILGRQFRPEEDRVGAPPVALIGYSLWQKQFAGDPTIVGRVVPINGRQTTIIGVMPDGWRFPEVSDIWLPLQLSEKENPRGQFFLDGFGVVKKGYSIPQARAELESIAARLATEYPDTNAGSTARVRPFRDEMTRNFKTLTLLVLGAVLFVHLIACANVANLLLARGATRAKEIGIRIALGASRGQIVRQLLTESLILSVAGSGLGLLLSVWGVDLMLTGVPSEIPCLIRFDFDWRILTFALGLGAASSIIVGLLPAFQASRPHLLDVLKDGNRSGGGGSARSQRVRNALVVAEVALALILLVGAGLMFRSFKNLQHTSIGADTSSTLTFRIGLPETQFPEAETPRRFFEQLIPKIAAIPGVQAAGAITSLPPSGVGNSAMMLEGEPKPAHLQDARNASQVIMTPGFLATARIPVLQGRGFTVADNADAPRVALIDADAARNWFPKSDPLGRRLRILEGADAEPKWATIVGVVAPVVYNRLTRTAAPPAIYFPEAQSPDIRFMSVAMRTKGDPKSFAKVARETVLAVNKDLPIYRVLTFDEVVAETFWERKFFSSLFSIFGGLALFLASIGLYGVISYSVRQRTQEIGVRMALGAQYGDVMRLVTGHGIRLIGIGLAIGFCGAWFLMKLFAGALHGVSAHDPLSFILVGLVLLLVGSVASYIPARAATRLNPLEALRYE